MNNMMKKCSFCIDIGTKQIYNNTRKNERTLFHYNVHNHALKEKKREML